LFSIVRANTTAGAIALVVNDFPSTPRPQRAADTQYLRGRVAERPRPSALSYHDARSLPLTRINERRYGAKKDAARARRRGTPRCSRREGGMRSGNASARPDLDRHRRRIAGEQP